MNRTYGKLGDGIIKNVECIGSSKVTGNFNDQSGGVYHTGFDNQDEYFCDTKVASGARDRAEYIPNNEMKDPSRISTRRGLTKPSTR